MSDEHNIDRLFQESFKDFEVEAPKTAWNSIEKRLTEKSKKRIAPLWLKLSGAAAVIAFVIMAGSQWFLSSNQFNNNSIVDKTPKNIQNTNNSNKQTNNIVTSNSDEDEINFKNSSLSSENENTSLQSNPNSALSNVSSAEKEISEKSTKSTKTKVNPSNDNLFERAIAYGSNIFSQDIIQQPNQIKASPIQKPRLSPQKSLIEVAENLNKEDDKIRNSKQKENTWFIKPQVSPIFYGNLGSGNAVDPNFAQNTGQSEVNMSYGINVAYQINDKIKLRSGVNRVNLNYTTNDVFFIQGQNLATLDNVNTNSNFNASVLNNQQLQNLSANGNLNRTEILDSKLQQELGFIEIPMELEYNILNKKIGINLIGGASTFLLNNNNLDIKNTNGTTSIGEANNINDLSFSTNFAVGLDYNISQRLMFNLEPTFKYQFNTFRNGTTDFQPYFLGLYSGLIFKF